MITLATARGRAYVSNNGDNTVSVISLDTLDVVATIPVGRSPAFLDVAPDGSRVYVVNAFGSTNAISVIDTATETAIATIPVGNAPSQLAISRDGARLYVTDSGANSISMIATVSNLVVSNGGTQA